MVPTPLAAQIRFGLGPVPGQTMADPARWLADQLRVPDPGPPATSTADAILAISLARQSKRENGDKDPDVARPREIFRTDTAALLDHAVTTQTPFRERLVWFWSNHFTVSTRRGEVAPMVGAYVREAIRPYVTGPFQDMLLAVMRHPAMLLYLDNAGSAGPHSLASQRGKRGLNENLARECLELHTVSPAAGYTQTDVTEFARILTGWSVERQQNPVGFRFRPAFAEPGDKTLLGRRFTEGEQGGIDALVFLAHHPATYRHLATKLVRHFVADTPPPDAVRRIEAVLHDTNGNLGAASLMVTQLPQAWDGLTKFRAPKDYVIAAIRAAGLSGGHPNLAALMAGLGQPPFAAPFPIGWPDAAADWAGPESLLRRVDWAYGFAGRPELPEPMVMADTALGPFLSDATATEIRRAGSRREAITLLLASPEFQRR